MKKALLIIDLQKGFNPTEGTLSFKIKPAHEWTDGSNQTIFSAQSEMSVAQEDLILYLRMNNDTFDGENVTDLSPHVFTRNIFFVPM